MIKLLAPTTDETADEGATVIVEMDQANFRALAAAVEVAFDDPLSVPAEFADSAAELWEFFGAGGRPRGPVERETGDRDSEGDAESEDGPPTASEEPAEWERKYGEELAAAKLESLLETGHLYAWTDPETGKRMVALPEAEVTSEAQARAREEWRRRFPSGPVGGSR